MKQSLGEQGAPKRLAPIHRITNYSTNLSENDWMTIHPLLPRVMLTSKNRKVDLRSVLDGISYWAINDVPINQIPEDLPRPGTIHYFCYRFAHDGTLQKIFQALGNKSPLVQGLQKKMKSLSWTGPGSSSTTSQDRRPVTHNQYKDKQK